MKYWALKTRQTGKRRDFIADHWDKFKGERVIAIGWEEIDISPNRDTSPDKLIAAIKKAYGGKDKSAATNAATIRKFVSISQGDKVLLCQGYAPNQVKKVRLYGTALVTGPFKDRSSEEWQWRFRHEAKVKPFGPNGEYVPKEFLVQRLQSAKTKKPLEALRQTLHEITKEGFERVVEDVGKRLGCVKNE